MVERRRSTQRQIGAAHDGDGTRRGESVVNGEGFLQFWASYPRKVGRLAAIREWNKLKVDPPLLGEILAGVDRYKRTKPGYADWCHPRTFLSQGRWMDEDDTPAAAPQWSDKAQRNLSNVDEAIRLIERAHGDRR